MWPRPQYTDLTYMGGTGLCEPFNVTFGYHMKSQYASLNVQFGVNRTFHVLKNQFTDLTYMGGTGLCGPITIIFGSVIQSWYTSVNIKFGVKRMFHVLKTPVYRFDYYGTYRSLWTDDGNFWQCYLELVYKLKYQIWCESNVPCAQVSTMIIFGRVGI